MLHLSWYRFQDVGDIGLIFINNNNNNNNISVIIFINATFHHHGLTCSKDLLSFLDYLNDFKIVMKGNKILINDCSSTCKIFNGLPLRLIESNYLKVILYFF
ncbi:hypothetical protein ACTFIW_011352 [Dictyostelium discoideum]